MGACTPKRMQKRRWKSHSAPDSAGWIRPWTTPQHPPPTRRLLRRLLPPAPWFARRVVGQAATPRTTVFGLFAVNAANTLTWALGPANLSLCPPARRQTLPCLRANKVGVDTHPSHEAVGVQSASSANQANTGTVPGKIGPTETGSVCHEHAWPSCIWSAPVQSRTLQKCSRTKACG